MGCGADGRGVACRVQANDTGLVGCRISLGFSCKETACWGLAVRNCFRFPLLVAGAAGAHVKVRGHLWEPVLFPTMQVSGIELTSSGLAKSTLSTGPLCLSKLVSLEPGNLNRENFHRTIAGYRIARNTSFLTMQASKHGKLA